MSTPLQSNPPQPATRAFLSGIMAAWTSVFALVLAGSYVGIGALAHEFGFSVGWMVASTLLVWAAPAQVILVSTLGAGAALIEVALAITLSAVRLLPMVMALLPLLRTERTRQRELILPAHFTAISMWVESLRLLPQVPRENRIAWCNGIGAGFMGVACAASAAGYYLAGGLPLPLAAMLLFLTPMSFLVSVVRNSRLVVDRLAFGLGFVVGPLLTWGKVDLALMWTGLIGGSAAYAASRLYSARKRRPP
ncbi:MAG: branched-chain amino acid ABC transporter permease [Rhizobiales bacterium]|nr:branched-chain amino acid ABC transporter permease [Hyphomicrobiales bacterium]